MAWPRGLCSEGHELAEAEGYTGRRVWAFWLAMQHGLADPSGDFGWPWNMGWPTALGISVGHGTWVGKYYILACWPFLSDGYGSVG
jgi:hypothetical protein